MYPTEEQVLYIKRCIVYAHMHHAYGNKTILNLHQIHYDRREKGGLTTKQQLKQTAFRRTTVWSGGCSKLHLTNNAKNTDSNKQ